MEIIVRVTKEELEELGMGSAKLNRTVLEDLDGAREYPGFSVKVEVVEEE